MLYFKTCNVTFLCCSTVSWEATNRTSKGSPRVDSSKIARFLGSVLGKATQVAAESGVIENEQASAAVKTAGSTVQEQAEMDPTEASASESWVMMATCRAIRDTSTSVMQCTLTRCPSKLHIHLDYCRSVLCTLWLASVNTIPYMGQKYFIGTEVLYTSYFMVIWHLSITLLSGRLIQEDRGQIQGGRGHNPTHWPTPECFFLIANCSKLHG